MSNLWGNRCSGSSTKKMSRWTPKNTQAPQKAGPAKMPRVAIGIYAETSRSDDPGFLAEWDLPTNTILPVGLSHWSEAEQPECLTGLLDRYSQYGAAVQFGPRPPPMPPGSGDTWERGWGKKPRAPRQESPHRANFRGHRMPCERAVVSI